MKDSWIYGNQTAVELYADRLPLRMLTDAESLEAAIPEIIRDYSNHKSAIIKTKDQTIAMLVKDRQSRCCQLDKKERIIARLRHRITELEETVHKRDMQLEERENAGEDLRRDPYSYLSDDDDFLEVQAMDFFTDEDDFFFIHEYTDSKE